MEKIKPLRQAKKVTCEKQDSNNCDSCNENKCSLYFNNYSGIFEYYILKDNTNNIETERVLVLHKKICRIIRGCDENYIDCFDGCPFDKSNNNIQNTIIDKYDKFFDKYNKFFEKFTFKIIEELSEHLPFSLFSPVRAHWIEADYVENDLLKLLIIYYNRDAIKSSISQILSNPNRIILETENLCRFDEVKYIDIEIITDIVQNPHRLITHPNGCIMGKYSPTHVLQYRLEESFDTLENRYIKNLLYQILQVIENFKKTKPEFFSKRDIDDTVIKELDDLRNFIEQALRHRVFTEVGELNKIPLNSQVLIKQTGYRELFSLDRLLRAKLIPNFMDNKFKESLALRSMDVLWELYVMTKILTALKELGFQIEEVEWDVRHKEDGSYDYASFVLDKNNKKIKVLYQETIEAGKTKKFELRPDFLLKCDERRIIIDAKYMIKEHVNTADLSKYLTANLPSEKDPSRYEKLSNGVFAACLKDKESGDNKAISFTHLFNEKLEVKPKTLSKLIESLLLNVSDQHNEEQYIGYILIELPVK
ncbi:MAG: DUF2357 domain-containing protein [Caldimicrobium sp.]|nr:DUF2357 domain-containing protein [Caldimicrobium sp.]MDW8093612.1 DUF2357 domain-containing protein [Caldimicrobium sp.]